MTLALGSHFIDLTFSELEKIKEGLKKIRCGSGRSVWGLFFNFYGVLWALSLACHAHEAFINIHW